MFFLQSIELARILERHTIKYVYCQEPRDISTLLIDPTHVESKKSSQIQWPVPSISAEQVDIFLEGE